jgi:hypothetical protein
VVRLLGLVALVVAGAVGYLLVRPGVAAPLTDPAGAVAECTAATGLDAAACGAWGARVSAGGAPSTTFELVDVDRLRLDRGLFGLAGSCRVEWFITRFPESPVWDDDVPCPDA